jgi:hypothetical protein
VGECPGPRWVAHPFLGRPDLVLGAPSFAERFVLRKGWGEAQDYLENHWSALEDDFRPF